MKFFPFVFAVFVLATGWPVYAQQAVKIPRIGYLSLRPAPFEHDKAFNQELGKLGWFDGRNIAIEYRWAAGKVERLPVFATELVRMKVDVIVASATPSVHAAKNATSSIPIVMLGTADAVGSGFVESLARPGGNITGVTNIMPELAGKRMELIAEIVPKLMRVAFLAYGPDPAHRLFVKEAQEAAEALKMQIQPLVVKFPEEIEAAFSKMVREQAGALIIQPIFFGGMRQAGRIIELAIKNRLPTISDGSQFVERGGLTYYGPNRIENARRGAALVDKILRGTKAADLPVEQPTKFELVINLKAAKHIGLTIPPNVLARADRVIR